MLMDMLQEFHFAASVHVFCRPAMIFPPCSKLIVFYKLSLHFTLVSMIVTGPGIVYADKTYTQN